MADTRFHVNAGPFALGEIAQRAGAELADPGKADRIIVDVRPLDLASSEHLSFIDNRKYISLFQSSKAGACIVHPKLADRAPEGMVLLLSEDPYRTYARAASLFYPEPKPEPGVAHSAFVDPSAKIGAGTRIDHGAFIGAGVEIGANCWIGVNATIGDGVTIGDDSRIGVNANISHALIGRSARIYPGVCIGQDGFGFAMGPEGHLKVPQLGRVVIEDDVEVGANSTIDRGSGPDTFIGQGTRIDNLVQIGHNVRMGKGCVIVSQTGISGSTKLGDFVVLGGQAGIAGHLTIGSGAQVAAQSGVMRDIGPNARMGGTPATTFTEWMRRTSTLEQLSHKK